MNTTQPKLTLIATKAREQPKLVFTSLMHLLTPEYLLDCFHELKKHKAPGVDTRTVESYDETEIQAALQNLVSELKSHRYRPQALRRVLIPKANGKTRPLGIPTVIDKTLQLAVAKILERLCEPLFLNLSYGFRSKRNAHEALKAVNHMVMGRQVNWIIDADIQGFFDNVNHDWMMKCLKQRISDPHMLSLIQRFLKAGVMTQGTIKATTQGTPQGGIVSPTLANIYLHYVLDLWFNVKERHEVHGYSQLIRYADDFVIGVQTKKDAQKVQEDMRKRLAKFGLTFAQDKTRILEFGRFAATNIVARGGSKPNTFDFLGFTHYCSKTHDGRFSLKVKTSRKKYAASLASMNVWLKTVRSILTLPDLWNILASKLRGHYQYYGVSGNFEGIRQFYDQTEQLTFKWTNRRSQKASWNWTMWREHLKKYPLPKPKLTYAFYNTW